MSSIDIINKVVYLTTKEHMVMTPKWIAEMKKLGYRIVDSRKVKHEGID